MPIIDMSRICLVACDPGTGRKCAVCMPNGMPMIALWAAEKNEQHAALLRKAFFEGIANNYGSCTRRILAIEDQFHGINSKTNMVLIRSAERVVVPALECGFEYARIHPSTWQSKLGLTRGDHSAYVRRASEYCGYQIKNEDMAAARCIWEYACCQLRIGHDICNEETTAQAQKRLIMRRK